MKKKSISGVKLENERILSLAFADDMVLMDKSRKTVIDMMSTFKKFLKERERSLNGKN